MSPAFRNTTLLACALFAAGVLITTARADNGGDEPLPDSFEHIRVLDFEGEIGAVLSAYVDRQAESAFEDGVDCLILRIDSPGGTVLHSREIADRLLEVPDTIHTVAWVSGWALSGAAMVALACNEIVMHRDAHLGDVQPGMPAPDGWKPAGEKMESPIRAMFRQYAEHNGYPAALAEAMVSARLEVIQVRDPDGNLHYVNGQDFRDWTDDAEALPGVQRGDLRQVGGPVVRKDELLTLTSHEAHRHGFTLRTFGDAEKPRFHPESEDELLEALKAPGAVVDLVEPSASERASGYLLKIAGVLSAIVAIAVLITLWQGPGTITIIGGVALVLVILINLTANQLHGFPLFLVGLGILLLAAEVFVFPGFGVAGFLGIASMGAGFLFLATGTTIGDTSGMTTDLAVNFGLQFVLTILLSLAALFTLSRFLPSFGPGRHLVLAAPGAPPATVAPATAAPATVGQEGVAASALRPAGSVEIGDRLFDVVTDGVFVASGARVRVTAVDGNVVTVEAIDTGSDPDDDEGEV